MRSLRLLTLSVFASLTVTYAAEAFTPNTPNISGALTNNDCINVAMAANYTLQDAGGPCSVPLASHTYNIQAVGGDYTTVRSAYTAFTANAIAAKSNITLNVAAGSYTDTSPLTIQSRFGNIFTIAGAATTAHTLTSIVSSSGSAGAWSITLQMGESVSNITPNVDYILVGNAGNGTNPTYMDGVFKVTSTNNGSSQITVTSLSQASAAPSGAVTANVTDVPTVLNWTGSEGIEIYGQSALALQNVVIACDASNGQWGIDEEDVSRLLFTGAIGVYNCGSSSSGGGMVENYNSQANGGTIIAISGGKDPLFVWGGATFQPAGGQLIATGGLGSGAGTDANIRVESGGYVNAQNAIASGGLADGMFTQNGGFIYAENSFSTGNALDGYRSSRFGALDILNATSSGNGGLASDVGWKPTNGIALNTSSGSQIGGITAAASVNSSGPALQINTTTRTSGDVVSQVLGNTGSHTVYAQGQVAQNAPMTIGSATLATASDGEVAIAKMSASGSAPGAGYLKFAVVAGTNAGSCKIIAYAGTSTTPVTVVDNVGSGC